jgi:hypothetical protein
MGSGRKVRLRRDLIEQAFFSTAKPTTFTRHRERAPLRESLLAKTTPSVHSAQKPIDHQKEQIIPSYNIIPALVFQKNQWSAIESQNWPWRDQEQ